MPTILCTGSRGWDNYSIIYDALKSIKQPVTIIVGDADGADEMFWKAATALNMPRLRYKARWKIEGRGAGPKRNTRMLRRLLCARTSVFALSAWDGKSPGTKDMMKQAGMTGVDIWLVGNLKGG